VNNTMSAVVSAMKARLGPFCEFRAIWYSS
jgi:hypothetical protein